METKNLFERDLLSEILRSETAFSLLKKELMRKGYRAGFTLCKLLINRRLKEKSFFIFVKINISLTFARMLNLKSPFY